jgi:hypothetical protein
MVLKRPEFEGLSLPSTYERIRELVIALRRGQIKAINDLKCLHWDKDGNICTNPSSTGFYQKPPVSDILPTEADDD